MPAWLWITALAAVAFVFWIGWGRGWWRSVRYSWAHAQHVIELSRAEYDPAPEYGSMILADEQVLHHELPWWPAPPVDPAPWLEQTMAELSPEALAGPIPVEAEAEWEAWYGVRFVPPDDPGPGVPPSSLTVAPGPVTAHQVAKPAVMALNGAPGYRDEAGRDAGESSHLDQPSEWLTEQLAVLRRWSEWHQQKAVILA